MESDERMINGLARKRRVQPKRLQKMEINEKPGECPYKTSE